MKFSLGMGRAWIVPSGQCYGNANACRDAADDDCCPCTAKTAAATATASRCTAAAASACARISCRALIHNRRGRARRKTGIQRRSLFLDGIVAGYFPLICIYLCDNSALIAGDDAALNDFDLNLTVAVFDYDLRVRRKINRAERSEVNGCADAIASADRRSAWNGRAARHAVAVDLNRLI